jgi:hypothetical protein
MVFGETVAVYCENRTEHTDTLWAECRTCSWQETHYVSTTKPSRLMLFGETVAVYLRTVRNTQIQCVGRMQSLLRKVYMQWPLGFKGLLPLCDRLCVRYTDLCLTIKKETPCTPYCSSTLVLFPADGPTVCCVSPVLGVVTAPVSCSAVWTPYAVQLKPFEANPK